VNVPSAKAMSAASASMKCAAKRLPRSITSSAAARRALPPIIMLREALREAPAEPLYSTLLGHSASHSERLFLPHCGHGIGSGNWKCVDPR
jgi:hypothetical protein